MFFNLANEITCRQSHSCTVYLQDIPWAGAGRKKIPIITKRDSIVTGENPSMADYLIWPWIERLYLLTDLSKFPVLSAWCAAMSDLPAVKKDSYPAEWHKKFIEMSKDRISASQLIGIEEKP